MGLSKQHFQLNGTKRTFYEFAKLIFENGQKTGTVRLGFKLPQISFFSFERNGCHDAGNGWFRVMQKDQAK